MNRRAPPLPAALAIAAMVAVGGCGLIGNGGSEKAPAERAGKGSERAPGSRGGDRAPSVVVGTVRSAELVDRIEAIGTARANEQAELTSPVTERITRINFRDGQYVARGAVIAELARGEQGASLSQAQARLREAQSRLERLQALAGQGFATRAQLDEAQAAADVARAQAAGARSQIGDRVVRAPFSGWLSLRRVSPGQVVNAGTPIVTIVDHSRIKLDFPVPEAYLAALAPGLAIEVSAAAFPDERFRGTVDSIDPVIDPVSRAATARALLPNPDLRLRPGMLMTVALESAPRTSLVVPESAVIGEGAQHFVWRLDASDRATRTAVQTGSRRDGLVEIRDGLAEGDRIVTEGTVKLRADGPVRPVEAAAPAERPA